MKKAIGVGVGIPFVDLNRGEEAGAVTGVTSAVKALSLGEDIKLFALFQSTAIDYTEQQNIGLSFNLEL